MMDEKCCGTCRHHKYHEVEDWEDDGWICTNEDSECYGEYTKYRFKCEEYEGRD